MSLETTEIPTTEYLALIEASQTLDALYAAGVDNWEGYGDALCSLEEDD